MKRNVSVFGFVIGVILPVLGLLAIYFVKHSSAMPLPDFLSYLARSHKEAATLLSLSILANIIPFIYYTNKRLDLTARGILIATMLYAVLIVLLKFVWN